MPNSIEYNAYRVLGLDVTASQKDILKRSKEIINRIKIEDYPVYDLDFGVSDKFRNEDAIKDALKRLQSTKYQIKEFFFWFHISDTIDEKALEFIKKGKFAEAIKTWKNASKSTNSTAYLHKKNLALLYCLLLLNENNPEYLKDSLFVWHEIIDSDKFWAAFSKIYGMTNEQSVSSETIINFKNNAVKYLSDIYTDLCQHHKNPQYVKDFQETFGGAHGEKTEKGLMQPIYQAVYDHIETLQKINIEENKDVSKKEINQIYENITSIKSSLDELSKMGLYNNSQSKIIRDRAADAIRFVSISLHNKTGQFDECVKLLKIALEICGTDSLKSAMSNELKELEKNPHIRCWFCKKLLNVKKDEESCLKQNWHRIIGTQKDFFGRTVRVQYQKLAVTIPRCKECADLHDHHSTVSILRFIGSVLLGIGAAVLFTKMGLSMLYGAGAALLCYVILYAFDVGKINKAQTKPVDYQEKFPFFKELSHNGWERGESPSV